MSGIKERVFAVLPLYNNGSTVKEVAARTRAVLPHVLIVDDGSTDLDLEAAFRGSDVTILRHSRNLGKGAALITALEYLKDKPGIDYMITLDADGQHEPEDKSTFRAPAGSAGSLPTSGCGSKRESGSTTARADSGRIRSNT